MLPRFSHRIRTIMVSGFDHERPIVDVTSYPPALRTQLLIEYGLAQQFVCAAGRSCDVGEFGPALALYREGVVRLARMFVLVQGQTSPIGIAARETSFALLLEALDTVAPSIGAGLRAGLNGVFNQDTPALARLSQCELKQRTACLDTACRALAARIVTAHAWYSKFGRWNSGATLCLILAVVTLVPWYWLKRPRNIALHKPVTTYAPPFDGTVQGAVDGKQRWVYDFHSAPGAEPWLAIDLKGRYTIDEVRVWGRYDCCYDQSIPLAVEVSDDNSNYRPIGTLERALAMGVPWVVTPRYVAARYVRLRTLKTSSLVLSEVEVYGRRVN